MLISSVQLLSRVRLFVTLWTAACQASLSITNSRSLRKLMSIELVMPSNHLILCRSLLFLPSIFPSIRVFSNELALCIRWPKYWSFSICPSNEYPGLISYRIDWFDLVESLAHYCLLLKLTSQVLCFHIGNSGCFCSCFSFKLLYVFKLRFVFL